MMHDPNNEMSDEVQAWLRLQLDTAVKALNDQQVFDDPLIESRPAWILPTQILLGKARAQGDPGSYRWFICGDLPFDHIGSGSATTPKEALRHFAMKWQLTADSLDGDAAASLVEDAESLYNLTEDERLWST